MPFSLRVLVALGLLAPVLVLSSIFTGITGPGGVEVSYATGGSPVEFFLVFLSSIPIALAAFYLMRRSGLARYFYVVGWMLVCFSPLFLSPVREDLSSFIVSASFNALIAIGIGVYLCANQKIRSYFNEK